MNRKIMYVLTFLFVIGSVFSFSLIVKYDKQKDMRFSTVTHADWPEKDFDELVEESDVIAIAQMENQSIKKEYLDEEHFIERRYSDLNIKEVLKGELETEIILNQALDYVEEGKQYLVFLRKGEDGYYYELTDDAIVPYEKGEYISNIKELTRNFKEKEIISEINKKINSLHWLIS